MMGKFVVAGPGAIFTPESMGGMPDAGMLASAMESERGVRPDDEAASQEAGPLRSLAVVVGLACAAAGVFVATGSRRTRSRRATVPEMLPSAVVPPPEHIERRQLVRLGAAGLAGAAVAKLATSQAAGAADRLGGIHVDVLTKIVNDRPDKGFPHHWTLTVYGPDNALSGMGWGGATDLKTAQDVFNSKMFPCIYSLAGALEGDLVKLHGLMLFSGAPDQGLPMTFEANLKTGLLHVNAYNTFAFEGTGTVARI
jgi:hypothetical protein